MTIKVRRCFWRISCQTKKEAAYQCILPVLLSEIRQNLVNILVIVPILALGRVVGQVGVGALQNVADHARQRLLLILQTGLGCGSPLDPES